MTGFMFPNIRLRAVPKSARGKLSRFSAKETCNMYTGIFTIGKPVFEGNAEGVMQSKFGFALIYNLDFSQTLSFKALFTNGLIESSFNFEKRVLGTFVGEWRDISGKGVASCSINRVPNIFFSESMIRDMFF